MTRSSLALLNSAVTIVVGGLALGHILWPFTSAAPATHRWGFVASMLLLGAARAARHAQLAGIGSRRRVLAAAVMGAAGVLGLALAAWWLVHGR